MQQTSPFYYPEEAAVLDRTTSSSSSDKSHDLSTCNLGLSFRKLVSSSLKKDKSYYHLGRIIGLKPHAHHHLEYFQRIEVPGKDVILNSLKFKTRNYRKGDIIYDSVTKPWDGVVYLQKGLCHNIH